MSTSHLTETPLLGLDSHDVDRLAKGLRDYLDRVNPDDQGSGLVQFHAMWNASIEDRSIESKRRRAILTETYRWLQGRRDDQERYRQQLREILSGWLPHAPAAIQQSEAIEQKTRRLERVLAGISNEIERCLPDEAIREGSASVILIWEDKEARMSVGPRELPSLRELVVRSLSLHGQMPGAEVAFFVEQILADIADQRLPLPNLTYAHNVEARSPSVSLTWRRPGQGSLPKKLPSWITEMENAPGLPSEAELDLYLFNPEVAQLLDEVVCSAAMADFRNFMGGRREQHQSQVELLMRAVAERTGRSPSEISELFSDVLLRHQSKVSSAGECAANTAALSFIWSQLKGLESVRDVVE